jgi:hypothetical protein
MSFEASHAEKHAGMPGDENPVDAMAGDDPLDAFRDHGSDIEEDAKGQEALGRPEDLKPGQRRIVDDEPTGD